MFKRVVLLLLFVHFIDCYHSINFTTLIITQKWDYELNYVEKFEKKANEELQSLNVNNVILKTHSDFEKSIGAWGIWPILHKLAERSKHSQWVFIVEPFTNVDWTTLLELTNKFDANDLHFLGRALYDREPVIIHHFSYGAQSNDKKMLYPDFSAGVLLSRGALKRIANEAKEHDKNDFTIDSKHEFAKFIIDTTEIELTDIPEFCLLSNENNCITRYEEAKYLHDEIGCENRITNNDVYYAVKTFSGYHKNRLVYIKRTWGRKVKYIDYFSDVADPQVPTIDLGIENTERGHCKKTLSIIKYFVEEEELKHMNWLVVADDDTLLNIEQLQKVINCLPTTKAILGERYGFGFDSDGIGGYSYPTGGSSFVMSRETARFIAHSCECPHVNSADDMIIGLCARRMNIPILHSPAFHQAQRVAYDPLYIRKITPISFHKFEDIDPYNEFSDYLESTKKKVHTEL